MELFFLIAGFFARCCREAGESAFIGNPCSGSVPLVLGCSCVSQLAVIWIAAASHGHDGFAPRCRRAGSPHSEIALT